MNNAPNILSSHIWKCSRYFERQSESIGVFWSTTQPEYRWPFNLRCQPAMGSAPIHADVLCLSYSSPGRLINLFNLRYYIHHLRTAWVAYGNMDTSTAHGSETSQVMTTMILCTFDYVCETNTFAKFGWNPPTFYLRCMFPRYRGFIVNRIWRKKIGRASCRERVSVLV